MSKTEIRRRNPHNTSSLSTLPNPQPSTLTPFESAPPTNPPYTPSFSLAFKLLLIPRVLSTVLTPIPDCDEVYNYWEPLHYLLYHQGLQTWEYSPDYMIRSWSYVCLHAVVGWVGRVVLWINGIDGGNGKIQLFYLIRMVFAVTSAYCETTFYRSISSNVNPYIGRYCLIILMCNPGMFHAAISYLPSTFAMFMIMLGYSVLLEEPDTKFSSLSCLFLFAGAVIFGWPFAGIIALPFMITILMKSVRNLSLVRNLAANAIVAVTCWTVPVILIDYLFYGKLLLVPLNIVFYNLFSNKGPDLYGAEPWYFYLINGFLNFGVVWFLCLIGIIIIPVTKLISKSAIKGSFHILSPLYLWLVIFSLQSHKEERFLYPIYPLIVFAGATTLNSLNAILNSVLTKSPPKGDASAPKSTSDIWSFRVTLFLLLSTTVFSVLRITAVTSSYNSPFNIYSKLHQHIIQLNHTDSQINVCVGKEWYRFPSSFFLPDHPSTRFRYVRSGFRGILPKYFHESPQFSGWEVGLVGGLKFKGPDLEGIQRVPEGMNDENREEMDRYVDPKTCHYFIDSLFPVRSEDNEYLQSGMFEKLYCQPYLDSQSSGVLGRVLWVPEFVRMGLGKWGRREWGEYCILKRIVYL